MFSKLTKLAGWANKVRTVLTPDRSKLCYNNETADRFKVNLNIKN
jgi:hypothetical protein